MATPAQDWFSQNAPQQTKQESDWFDTNKPTHGAGGSWEPQESVAVRFLKNFASPIHAALMNPNGVGPGPALPAAKLDEQGNLLPMSQQTPTSGSQTFSGMGRDIADFGQQIIPINQALSGDVSGALGKATANLLMMGGAKRAASGATAPTAEPTLLEPQRGVPPTPEVQANKLTRAINPVAQERPQLQENLLNHAGNILDYASKNGIDLKTPQDFVKAARGAGQQAKDFYQNDVLGPAKNEVVITPGGYGGKTAGPGIATLQQIDSRIADINKQLEPAYVQTDKGMVAVKLNNASDLTAEAGSLRKILYNELSQRTGIAPEDIGGLRERFGSLKNIADTTDAAIGKRESGVDMAVEGRSNVPLAKVAILTHAVARALGLNPESIATKRILSAISDITIPPTELPKINKPLSLNLGASKPLNFGENQ